MTCATSRLAVQPEDVTAAARRLAGHVHRTPVFTGRSIDAEFGCSLKFKCENFQRVGAFKFRGASNAILNMTDRELAAGVATHSSGNHAAALALAARLRGAKATVVMPNNAARPKRAAVARYGARIIDCEPTQAAREETLAELVQSTGCSVVEPFDDPRVIAGQGSAAVELLEDCPDLDLILAPVGGGGLLAGTALAAAARTAGSRARVIGVEPLMADDAYRSFAAGSRLEVVNPKTVADGLRTSVGKLTFPIILEHVSQILVVGEDSIVEAMRMLWERLKLVVEPSGAVPLAALLEGQLDGHIGSGSSRIGIVLSGGNVDLDALPWAVA